MRAVDRAYPKERRSGLRAYARVTVGGVPTACLSRSQLAHLMAGDCLAARSDSRPPRLVFSANGHSIAMAALDRAFHNRLVGADLIHADGKPVVFASRLLTRTPVPERSATTDFLFDAAAVAEAQGLKFFLLGSTDEINARCAAALHARHPNLEIVGRHHGYFGADEEAALCDEINRSGADVLWVGMGIPLEYDFCLRNKARLRPGWIVTCGGCFNFAAGDYVRAPAWMQAWGFEWLFRMWREPRRLFWRYLVTNPVAIAVLLLRTRSAAQAA
ncbi:MAG: WecB/TagA/CpsF family glycosyltransferase [Alphaproteobacteria bacterium]|nr:WecB/TagA/CpsF family glycosyltransferase [Alphaproteobacteria bacterium]